MTMKNTLNTIKSFLAIISGVAFILYLIRLFKDQPQVGEFPKAAEKAVAKKEVEQVKEELKDIEDKQYSDEEIEKRFNK